MTYKRCRNFPAMIRYNLEIDKDLWDRLLDEAARRRMTLGNLADLALEEWLGKERKNRPKKLTQLLGEILNQILDRKSKKRQKGDKVSSMDYY